MTNNKIKTRLLAAAAMLIGSLAQAQNHHGDDDSTGIGPVVHDEPYKMPAAKDCPTFTGHWTVGSYSCSGDLPASSANAYVEVEDAKNAGSEYFSCDGSSGQWVADNSTASCTVAPTCVQSTVYVTDANGNQVPSNACN